MTGGNADNHRSGAAMLASTHLRDRGFPPKERCPATEPKSGDGGNRTPRKVPDVEAFIAGSMG